MYHSLHLSIPPFTACYCGNNPVGICYLVFQLHISTVHNSCPHWLGIEATSILIWMALQLVQPPPELVSTSPQRTMLLFFPIDESAGVFFHVLLISYIVFAPLGKIRDICSTVNLFLAKYSVGCNSLRMLGQIEMIILCRHMRLQIQSRSGQVEFTVICTAQWGGGSMKILHAAASQAKMNYTKTTHKIPSIWSRVPT